MRIIGTSPQESLFLPRLWRHWEDDFHLTKEQEAWVISIMLSVTLVKLLLVLYCRFFTNEIVKAYAQDHFFDVITNIIGLVAVLVANYVNDFMDPVGAILFGIIHHENMVEYGAGKCKLPGRQVSSPRVSPETNISVLEPPQGHQTH
ncbi:hypothetical protein IFM89_031729 [Coptis chinensis]|uniref:Cation efflux protein transmembrane domain-containing protein n=1 Tax=Coptis chinensis TaxID=261450 RepID=A0A835LD43_9MAGN|nr:hypothetical protein IFM89_031729 [Coptis chinensis]